MYIRIYTHTRTHEDQVEGRSLYMTNWHKEEDRQVYITHNHVHSILQYDVVYWVTYDGPVSPPESRLAPQVDEAW